MLACRHCNQSLQVSVRCRAAHFLTARAWLKVNGLTLNSMALAFAIRHCRNSQRTACTGQQLRVLSTAGLGTYRDANICE